MQRNAFLQNDLLVISSAIYNGNFFKILNIESIEFSKMNRNILARIIYYQFPLCRCFLLQKPPLDKHKNVMANSLNLTVKTRYHRCSNTTRDYQNYLIDNLFYSIEKLEIDQTQ